MNIDEAAVNKIIYNLPPKRSTIEPLLYDHPQNHIGVVV